MPEVSSISSPLVTTRDELAARLSAARKQGKTIGLVPTMGALHAGHASLAAAARRECDFTVATIFVNPTQFAPHEDLARYPRTLEADLKLLAAEKTDLVFAPANEEIYQPGHATTVHVGGLSAVLEGKSRPNHFDGVATIVLKLFQLIPADRAYFGAKDYQQALVVQRMVTDLDVPIQIRVCPTVREADGLAMSARNVYLSPTERQQALGLSRGLRLARQMVEGGERNAVRIATYVRDVMQAAGVTEIDYVSVADCETLSPVETLLDRAVLLVAARVGATRLIDNEILSV